MTEVEFRFPSDQAYAYFGVKGTPEELGQINYELLAALYVNAQKAVITSSIEAKQLIVAEVQAPAEEPQEYAVGDSVEVAGLTFTKHSEPADVLSEPTLEQVKAELSDGDHDSMAEARAALKAGGVETTEISSANEPPWKQPAPKAGKKAWEKSKPKAEVSSESWDF